MHKPTLLGAAMVAYLLAKVAHEGLGHGGACVATGHTLVAFTTSWCDCDLPREHAGALVVEKAAGTLANLAVGLVALVGLRLSTASAATRYGLWVIAAVNLLMGLGYVFTDPLFGFGDWTAILDVAGASWLGRVGLGAAGGAAYVATAMWLARAAPLAGPDARAAGRQAMLLPYVLVGGVAMTAAALMNPLGPTFAFTSALATMGGTSALAWMPATLRGPASGAPVERHVGWMAAGAVALLLALAVFGPGVTVSAAPAGP